MHKGTKITYKSLGKNPDGDNRINLRSSKVLERKEDLKELLNDDKLHFIHVTDHDVFAVNKLVHGRNKFLLLEPNPVTFYFSIAFDLIPQFENAKKQLDIILSNDSQPNGLSLAIAYSLIFRISSIGVIFSLLAVEAFMNQQLPDYTLIKFKNKSVSKDKIQRWASFEDKLKTIIPSVTDKNFCRDHPKRGDKISRLKRLRDELIHLKQQRNDGLTSYNEIYQDVLDVDLKSLVSTVKFYINYHQPKTIRNFRRKATTNNSYNNS